MTRIRRAHSSPHYNQFQRYTTKEHRNSILKLRCKSKSRDKYVRDGGRLGKPKGVGIKSKEQLQTEYKGVIKNLKAGQSVRNTAKITGTSPSTVQRIKKEFAL